MTQQSLKSVAGQLAGKFLVLDGPDGAGKGTQLAMLNDALAAAGLNVLNVRDPGGTRAGDMIRQILLHSQEKLTPQAETLLFMASRAQLVEEKIRPALAAGQVVLCDRYVSATCAYQGAIGISRDAIIETAAFAVGETWPQLTVILDVPVEVGLERIGVNGGRSKKATSSADQGVLFHDAVPDAMEARSLAFHRKVREIFRSLPRGYPGAVVVVDGTADPATLHRQIVEDIVAHFRA